ncbi:MAG TPA: hypothetical protein GXZ28_08220 [Clostridiales bacterium]|nr:hypothetical protein [Clostridiales bacterium]
MKSNTMIMKKTIKLISNFTDIKKSNIKAETKLKEELGLTSFDFASLIFEFEEVFSIKFENWDELNKLVTIQDIVDLIVKYSLIKKSDDSEKK